MTLYANGVLKSTEDLTMETAEFFPTANATYPVEIVQGLFGGIKVSRLRGKRNTYPASTIVYPNLAEFLRYWTDVNELKGVNYETA